MKLLLWTEISSFVWHSSEKYRKKTISSMDSALFLFEYTSSVYFPLSCILRTVQNFLIEIKQPFKLNAPDGYYIRFMFSLPIFPLCNVLGSVSACVRARVCVCVRLVWFHINILLIYGLRANIFYWNNWNTQHVVIHSSMWQTHSSNGAGWPTQTAPYRSGCL